GANHLVLIGRRTPDEKTREKFSKFKNVNIEFESADICDYKRVRKIFEKLKKRPIGGILHLAGVLSDSMIVNQTWESFYKVLPPKIIGAWNLHLLSLEFAPSLDMFIMFSSAASLFGSPGQINYSSANAFLDSLSHYRKLMGLPCISINWGNWSEV